MNIFSGLESVVKTDYTLAPLTWYGLGGAADYFITPQTVEELKKVAADFGKAVAQLAIAWVLRRQEVTSAIVGARKPKQIEETAPAGDWILDAEVLKRVDAILQRNQ